MRYSFAHLLSRISRMVRRQETDNPIDRPAEALIPPNNSRAPLFEFRGIEKVYPEAGGGAVKVLSGFDAEIPAGEIIALMGDNGAGKSTVANLITGLDSQYSGDIFHLGRPVPKNESPALRLHRRSVAYIGQQFNHVPHLRALDNVALALLCQGIRLTDARAASRDALAQVGLGDFSQRLPSKLSLGQQQRVAIARALASGASTIVADEPSGNLDVRGRDQLMKCFRICQQRGQSILMITHSSSLARACDRVLAVQPAGLLDVTVRLCETAAESDASVPGAILAPAAMDEPCWRVQPTPAPALIEQTSSLDLAGAMLLGIENDWMFQCAGVTAQMISAERHFSMYAHASDIQPEDLP